MKFATSNPRASLLHLLSVAWNHLKGRAFDYTPGWRHTWFLTCCWWFSTRITGRQFNHLSGTYLLLGHLILSTANCQSVPKSYSCPPPLLPIHFPAAFVNQETWRRWQSCWASCGLAGPFNWSNQWACPPLLCLSFLIFILSLVFDMCWPISNYLPTFLIVVQPVFTLR